MRTPEQLKGQIRSFAVKHKLMSQEVLQMYLFEIDITTGDKITPSAIEYSYHYFFEEVGNFISE